MLVSSETVDYYLDSSYTVLKKEKLLPNCWPLVVPNSYNSFSLV